MTISQPSLTNACRVWFADIRSVDQALISLLSPDERDRHARFRRPADQDRYLAGHALTRRVTGDYLGLDPAAVRYAARCPNCGPGHGKPHVIDEGPEFSLSHSGNWVALAVAEAPVGVDVEAGRPTVEQGLIDFVLSEAERADLAALPATEHAAAFVTYWTRKEAVLKATGHGLSIGPARLTLSPPDAPAALRSWDADPTAPGSVVITDLRPDHEHQAAVAVLSSGVAEITTHDGTALISEL